MHTHDEDFDREAQRIEAELIERRLAQSKLKHFVARFTPEFIPGWHIDEICAAVETIEAQIQQGRGTDARLIVEAPPRHTKSQIISRCTPLWYLGRHPAHEVVVATYGQDLADDVGRWAKMMISDPAFQAIFPNLEFRKDSKAANRLETINGGGIRYVGVGGALTGRGGHLLICIAEGQRVMTRHGLTPIENVRVGDEVLTHERRWKKVSAVRCNGRRPIVRVHAGGHSLVCTPDHLVYTPRGWEQAQHARSVYGYEKLRSLRADHNRQAEPTQKAADVLSALSFEARPHDWEEKIAETCHMSGMSSDIQAEVTPGEILLEEMQEPSPLPRYDRRVEPQLQRWKTSARLPTTLQEASLQSNAARCTMLGMPNKRPTRCTSHRRDTDERLTWQSGRFVPWVPYEVSQIENCGTATVYDITVEEDSSFVCEGFVVHNCDDPIKSSEDADSETLSAALWNWYTAVLRTRLAPGGGMVVLHTRWRINDLIGRLIRLQDEGEGERFKRLTFTALAEEDDPWGREVGEPLQKARFTREDLEALRKSLPARDWLALYQQKPMADEGNIFKVEDFHLFAPAQLPKNLHWHIAADGAFSTRSSADMSCIWPYGIDVDGCLWLSPHFVHARINTSVFIDELLRLAYEHHVLSITLEGGGFWRAIEPELKRRMIKSGRYYHIHTPAPTKDKYTRSRPAHARMSAGMLKFPNTRYVTERVIPEFLVFTGTNDEHDDVVDTVAWMGHAAAELIVPNDEEFDADVENFATSGDRWTMFDVKNRQIWSQGPKKRNKHAPERLLGGERQSGSEYRYC